MKILLVGGTWTVDPQVNPEIDRRSSLVDFVYQQSVENTPTSTSDARKW